MAPAPRAPSELRDLIIQELGRPAGPQAQAMAATLAAPPGAAAVRLYGPRPRAGGAGGPGAPYLLTDSDTA